MITDENQLVTIAQAAEIAGYGGKGKIELFRYYIKKGYTPELQIIGGRKFFDRRTLEGWKPKLKRKSKYMDGVTKSTETQY